MNRIFKTGAAALCVTAAMMLAGCGSQKQATSVAQGGIITEMDQHKAQAERVQTKMQMALRTKDHHFSVGGNLRMERGKIVQLSIMPFSLVEVGVIEFTPDYVLMLYRTGHQYVKARYKDIELLANNGLDFNAIQALFWGEVFAPGRKVCTMDDFETTTSGNTIVLSSRTGKSVMAKFVTSVAGSVLRQTQVTGAQATYNGAMLNWKYMDYMRVGKGEMPSIFEMSIDNIDSPVSCRFTLSSLKINPEWKGDISTKIDKQRYDEVSLESILTLLLNFNR